ncbi:3'3'-cGAMP-specific phosphodiesterase 3 [Rhodoferax lithotrophicus]|uniref:3'3'-cGAMP-specific phosphodiesterase 3 n=1 Tax=Rhodoferax lithotrophicus TaxID=2798804 RepID=A0ABN6D1H8_9BURK|nr:HD domain-containing phosphohydrolase [Rhodoferax sp. MIZ03]BCO25488.1 3'3'-cGAMP-specific phosphodiesterase 3 [Rhodoferax sp. MIZ03]
MQSLKLAELMGALSHALDITEGQPEGHCVRCCWIGMHIGQRLGLSNDELWTLYYTLLLKDLGCSSNAARICQLYVTDDLSFKRDFKWVDGSLPQVLRFVLRQTGPQAGLMDRLRALGGILKHGDDIAQELIQTRCTRGADIARQLRFPESVAQGIHALDEHWNGQGRPDHLAGHRIPVNARIALLAQVIDVHHAASGQATALAEVQARRGSWFDPELVDVFLAVCQAPLFWQMLGSTELERTVYAMEPGGHEVRMDEDYLDDITEAFGQVVDAKSPYTAGHSARVGLYTALLGEAMQVPESRRRWLKRGALLHDVGKLGVSNAILDKPGKLDDAEWKAVQRHASYTEAILSRVRIFDELAVVAAAHHERLDGNGYPKRLAGADITLETRIITTADIFDAITAERPYRGAVPVDQTLGIMAENVGTALDANCFAALKHLVARSPELFPG